MIPEDSPLRCPTCRGIHPGSCPIDLAETPVRVITDEEAEATWQFLERCGGVSREEIHRMAMATKKWREEQARKERR